MRTSGLPSLSGGMAMAMVPKRKEACNDKYKCRQETKHRLNHFNIPVTKFFPNKVVNFVSCYTKFKFIKIFCHIFCQSVNF